MAVFCVLGFFALGASGAFASETGGHLSAPPVEDEPAVHLTPGVAKAKGHASNASADAHGKSSKKGQHKVAAPASGHGAATEPGVGASHASPETDVPGTPEQGATSATEKDATAHGGATEEEMAHGGADSNRVVTPPKGSSDVAAGGATKGWLWFAGVFAVLAFLIFVFT